MFCDFYIIVYKTYFILCNFYLSMMYIINKIKYKHKNILKNGGWSFFWIFFDWNKYHHILYPSHLSIVLNPSKEIKMIWEHDNNWQTSSQMTTSDNTLNKLEGTYVFHFRKNFTRMTSYKIMIITQKSLLFTQK